MGSGVLFFNSKGELLIVKPNYKDGWSIPGGTVDEKESPRSAAIREVKEEIGLEISDLELLCVDYTTAKGIRTESLQFIFFGGKLDNEQIAEIKLQEDELDMFKFVRADEVVSLLLPGLKERIPECLEDLKNKKVLYRES